MKEILNDDQKDFICRKLADAGLSPLGEKLSNLTDEQLKWRIELRGEIDTEFGPIQLDQEEVG